MSQRKVDRYKEEKRNRQEIMRKERLSRRLEITLVIVIAAALLGWFGYLLFQNAQANAEPVVTELKLGAVDEFQNKLTDLVTAQSESSVSEAE